MLLVIFKTQETEVCDLQRLLNLSQNQYFHPKFRTKNPIKKPYI